MDEQLRTRYWEQGRYIRAVYVRVAVCLAGLARDIPYLTSRCIAAQDHLHRVGIDELLPGVMFVFRRGP